MAPEERRPILVTDDCTIPRKKGQELNTASLDETLPAAAAWLEVGLRNVVAGLKGAVDLDNQFLLRVFH